MSLKGITTITLLKSGISQEDAFCDFGRSLSCNISKAMSLCLMKKFQTNYYVLCDVVFGYYRDLSSIVDVRQWENIFHVACLV